MRVPPLAGHGLCGLLAAVGVGILTVLLLPRGRAEVAQAGVQPVLVVPVDPGEDRPSGVGPGGEPVAVDQLAQATVDLGEDEVGRAKALMKVGLLSALESSPTRAERAARQTALFGRVIAPEEIVAHIDALSVEDVRRVGRRMLATAPTLTSLGPVAQVPTPDRVTERLGRL